MKRTVTMTLVKETKGALRYEGLGDDAPDHPNYLIGTLYLRKSAVYNAHQGDYPTQITVTVEG